MTKGTGLALARQVRQVDAAVAQAQTHILRDGSAFDVNRAFA